jgi:hypothetical protein
VEPAASTGCSVDECKRKVGRGDGESGEGEYALIVKLADQAEQAVRRAPQHTSTHGVRRLYPESNGIL